MSINQKIAAKLQEIADVLEQQKANPFRVNAYRRAASTISSLETSVEEIVEKHGTEGLIALPSIGEGIARTVFQMVTTGRFVQLERLRGVLEPKNLFQTVPGIGPDLAQRIFDTLSVDSLESLEMAAYDGRLQKIHGIGLRRAAAIRAAVGEMMLRRLKGSLKYTGEEPPVELLLRVDSDYREKAEAGILPNIVPKRFNPSGAAWLPVLHTDHGKWHFTVLYSNTAKAHELGRTRDWVVIYFYDEYHREGQRTVVTETRGTLVGRRVVRGREVESRTFIEQN